MLNINYITEDCSQLVLYASIEFTLVCTPQLTQQSNCLPDTVPSAVQQFGVTSTTNGTGCGLSNQFVPSCQRTKSG